MQVPHSGIPPRTRATIGAAKIEPRQATHDGRRLTARNDQRVDRVEFGAASRTGTARDAAARERGDVFGDVALQREDADASAACRL